MAVNLEAYRLLLIRMGVDQFRQYVIAVSSGLQAEVASYHKRLEKMAAELGGEAKDDLYEHHSDDLHELESEFPKLLAQTSFVALYSFVEVELHKYCKLMKQRLSLKLDVKDLKDKGIVASSKYLAIVCDNAFPNDSEEWKRLLIYNKVRNVLVHNNGELKPDSSEHDLIIDHIADSNDQIIINSTTNVLSLNLDYCLNALKCVENFFILLADKVDIRLKAIPKQTGT